MAAFDFPSSPSVNQTYTANGVTWKWNGTMWMRVSGAGYLEKIEEGNSKVEVDDSGSGNITATTDGTERLRITSGGDVSIGGLASPRAKLDIEDAGTSKDVILRVSADDNNPYALVVANDTFNTTSNRGFAFWVGADKVHHIEARTSTTNSENEIMVSAGDAITFRTNVSEERLRIDSAGRLGLGVVPEAFHSNNKAVIRGDSGYAILGRSDNSLNISQNFYYDSSDAGKYIANGEASLYNQSDGSHSFYSAASGSADASASMVERLRITSTGVVGINKSSPSSHAQLDIVGSSYWPILVKTTSTTGGGIAIKNKDDVTSLYVGSGGSSWLTGSPITDGLIRAQNNLLFGTDGNNERLRIDTNGHVGIDCTPDDHNNFSRALDVNGPSGAAVYMRTNDSTSNFFIVGNYGSEAYLNNRANGNLRLYTNSSERLRITNDGKIGIKVTSPGCQTGGIHAVHDATEGTPSFTGGEVGIFQRNYNSAQGCEIGIIGGSNSYSRINFGDKDDADIGIISYSHNDNSMRFIASAAERLRITSGGDVLIADTTNAIYDDSTGGGMNLKANGQLVLKKQASSTADPLMWLNDTGQTTNKFILFAQDGNEKASIGLAGNDLRFARDGYNETLRITSDGDLKTGNINISSYANTHDIDNYSVFLSDNHANTFFGQNLRLDYSGTSGNHQLKVINQHSQIGGAGMLIGGNQSPNKNELNFYTVAGNQPAGTRVDDTNKRLTIRTNGDITIRGTNSQYVEAAAFEQTAASKNAIIANNGGWVSFQSLRNTNSTIISHDPNSNSGRRITFPVAGAVHFSMYQDIKVSGTTGYTQCRLYKNGSADRYALITYTNNQWDSIMMNTVVEVAANDYLEFYYTGGTITSMDNSSWLSYNFIFYPINTNRG